uniref:(northern house mosquito) hypothetical protein n=1 Tax=Culex pipiens TaxID=7175 RepID=A0A8D8BCD4_CULPI
MGIVVRVRVAKMSEVRVGISCLQIRVKRLVLTAIFNLKKNPNPFRALLGSYLSSITQNKTKLFFREHRINVCGLYLQDQNNVLACFFQWVHLSVIGLRG